MLKTVCVLTAAVFVAACAAPPSDRRAYQSPPATAGQVAPAAPQVAYSLKEFRIGDPMAACPAATVHSQVSGGIRICLLGPTTLANQDATEHSVWLFEGKVIGASFTLKSKGQYANSAVRLALVEKYGRPFEAKDHINEATWRRGTQILQFEGWKGSVSMLDQLAARRASAGAAAVDKNDL